MAPKVDIGIVTAGSVASEWWRVVTGELLSEQANGIEIKKIRVVSSALPDHNKNRIIDKGKLSALAPSPNHPDHTIKRRNSLTDQNRHALVQGFMEGEADWLFFLDDDTVPPDGALSKLLSLGREFVAGLYFLGKPPHNPIAYFRGENGLYKALWRFSPGQLLEMDSVGMGCTLIHRSVFERIVEGHVQYQRPNGALFALPKDAVRSGGPSVRFKDHEKSTGFVSNGVYHMPVIEREDDDRRPFPFYSMEYGRTEDHHFCELASNVGIKPWLDTSIVCDHWKLKAVNKVAHRIMMDRLDLEVVGNGSEPSEANVEPGAERESIGS